MNGQPMTKEQCLTELAVLIGRAGGARLLGCADLYFCAGCLSILAEEAGIETVTIREAIAPLDLDKVKEEANKP